MIRVRFAPSPTGYLHIGGLRTALYNELFVRHSGGTLVLRVEDTDQTRFVDGATENFIRSLNWAGIEFDEGTYLDESGQVQERGDFGPYFQSKRLEIYRQYAELLMESGQAYRCFCSPERLEGMRMAQQAAGRPVTYDRQCLEWLSPEESKRLSDGGHPFVVRLKVPTSGLVEFNDAIRGKIGFRTDLMDDQILLKTDGFPTYHLANVVDDHLMGITHVIRGEEWLPSTPKHILLYRAFGWEPPVFAHLPLLLNPDRSKLSKRQGDVAVEDYRNQGYLPEALTNFIALLGWNPRADQEIYSKNELIDGFDLGKVNKGGAVFSREKLDWMNREYMKRLTDGEMTDLARPFFVRAGLVGNGEGADDLIRIVHVQRDRANRLSDLTENCGFLFSGDYELDPGILPWKKSTPEIAKERLVGLRDLLSGLPKEVLSDRDGLERALLDFVAKWGWTNAESLWPLRVALTGQAASPGPADVIWVIGREKTIERLKRAIDLLEKCIDQP
ncbi:glutamate--tRNA ligase [Candidatus Uhrbacteria bacterium]|nr:glutamate--tRNA ligase [Candidatus Uhrbacteria bacterium]